MSIVVFLIILFVLVLVHEFGHFWMAKSFNIKVDEFGFGFPPKLFGIKKGETEYTFNLLPIGGFVKIFGENPNEENTNGPDSARSFVNKPKYKQAIVLLAGVFANFLLAFILFSAVLMLGTAKMSLYPAVLKGMKVTLFITKNTVLGLYTLIVDGLQGKGSLESITGPVGLVGMIGSAYKSGFTYLLSFTALISVNLTIINLLPFPALDGGRLFFLLIEKIKGSRINPKITNTANIVGFCILIFIMLLVTYHDVVKLF